MAFGSSITHSPDPPQDRNVSRRRPNSSLERSEPTTPVRHVLFSPAAPRGFLIRPRGAVVLFATYLESFLQATRRSSCLIRTTTPSVEHTPQQIDMG